MKCITCEKDCKYGERQDGRCPHCHGPFCFEPRRGDPVSDAGFKQAIEAVSSQAQVRWGVEHLYYEICRRRRKIWKSRALALAAFAILATFFATFMWLFLGVHFNRPLVLACWIILAFALVFGSLTAGLRNASRKVSISPEDFDRMWGRWLKAHGPPAAVIARRKEPVPKKPAAEPDLADYSFDRAVICDRARTVDLLLANNFHFENNCAVLSANGYPPGPFETVRTMLRRNPKLQVFVLHDATPEGCTLAARLRGDPAWFQGRGRVIDVGLTAAHAQRFRGLWRSAPRHQEALLSQLPPADAKWLAAYCLELAVIRPEQVLKRLYRAISGSDKLAEPLDADGGDAYLIESDHDSFGSDAGAIDDGVDGFG